MQRIALALAVWSVLLLTVAGLAMLALPEVGPPMPRATRSRVAMDALVPESDVERDVGPRRPVPDDLSSTVAPAVDPEPGTAATTAPEPAPAAESPRSRPSSHASAAREEANQGLGVLPAGVPAEDEGFGVHAVRADGRPAIDATVRWLLQRDLDALRAQGRDPATMDPAELLATSTRTLRTNNGGFAMLTSEAGTMWMDVRLGDQYGWTRIRREDTGHARIVMARDTTLAVDVVDSSGKPRAGVPVVLRGAACQTIWSGTTDAAGRAQLAHADGAIAAARSRHQDLSIAVDVPNGDSRALVRGEIPAEPVSLVAEPGQRVLVWLRDVAAQPCARPTRVRLAPVGAESDCGAARERTSDNGLAVFEDVPVHASYVAIADPSCSPEPLRADVSVRPAAESNVILAARSAMPRIRGRLVDAGGSPWRTFDVAVHVASADGWLAQVVGRAASTGRDPTSVPGGPQTGDRGEFELDLPALHGAREPVVVTIVARNSYGRTVCSESIELSPEPAGNPRDLGHVRATDWPILVRGGVVDENEQPLAGAAVEMCAEDGRPDPRTRTLADERGQFVIRGPAPQGDALLLHAVEPELRAADATVAVRRGEWRARVVIAVHGQLRGSVLLPPDAPEGCVLVRVAQASGSEISLTVDPTGTFAFSNVQPGDARVSFTVQGFDQELLAIDGVGIPRGGVATDARLVDVDLRERIVVVELEVVDENGQPLPSGWAGPVTTGDRPRGRSYDMVDGIARVAIAVGGPALQVSADGYDPAILQSPRGRVRVELEPSGG
jgi:hypothetical protein